MAWIVRYLWLIPILPMFAACVTALLSQKRRRLAPMLAIGSMVLSLLLAILAFAQAVKNPDRVVMNFPWMQFGSEWVRLGWMLDPLAALMLLMVTFVGLWIFIYSLGYMHHDENIGRFFCFLSLFAGAMLGLLIANSLLLLFMCWEIVGLTSYLLIGFWYQRPAAAAAAKKAFITTRIGDLGLLLGMVWLYGQTGTLLFYDHGAGCMEQPALAALVAHTTVFGMAVSTAIALLIFCGAVGKSGQFPLHVWLPDAMEGPTPVSALIHAATMVAAGVYLVARVFPLMRASSGGGVSSALTVVGWIGAATAFLAALVAVAQTDIKRILAYSTISQLGYMMIGVAAGGVAIGVFHLITHAFFKALLFLGAGSVIHGCIEEQDIRYMGGLRKWMPVTFVTYAIGTLALCGFPLFFSGFWSKDGILHAAQGWQVSRGPFYLGAAGALLTAFYMTRQVCYVFFGRRRAAKVTNTVPRQGLPVEECSLADPHESPRVMTVPLGILALFAIVLGWVGTPAWPWLQSFLTMQPATLDWQRLAERDFVEVLLLSSVLVFAGLWIGWRMYGHKPIENAEDPDPLQTMQPATFRALGEGLYIDRFYDLTFRRGADWIARIFDWIDRWLCTGVLPALSWTAKGLGWIDLSLDRWIVNESFDQGCKSVAGSGRLLSRLQNGRVQTYLRVMGIALATLAVLLLWGRRG
jgi:NADH-quinone oxidoreductase subunit L